MMHERVMQAWNRAEEALWDAFDPSRGRWVGSLSGSAVSTALATVALHRLGTRSDRGHVESGVQWLTSHQNGDGGWGDTPDSPSNLTASFLAWGCLRGTGTVDGECVERVEAYLSHWCDPRAPDTVAAAVLTCYGDDRTFSAPILMFAAMTGCLGDQAPWQHVPQLPFELAALPLAWFRWVGLPVVSYAIPALIAVGLARHKQQPDGNALQTTLRALVEPRVRRVLDRMQPIDGGFLEAVPLTAFVLLGLAAAGTEECAVASRGLAFLRDLQRHDGAWPIDRDLSTWVTTLAVKALAPGGGDAPTRDRIVAGLLRDQFTERHAFTGARPGGWGWTDHPGAVPDADDTAGALLALAELDAAPPECRTAARHGVEWLMGLQNSDGGLPTFCRGWGRLPFDRSCPDLTIHALLAWDRWYDVMPNALQGRMDTAMNAAMHYLEASCDTDGAWRPLWFGCQAEPDKTNPVYGTSLVVRGLRTLSPERLPERDELVRRGVGWLCSVQLHDGGWSGGAHAEAARVEETALALSALAGAVPPRVVESGLECLLALTDEGRRFPASPIGLYFATLWYAERLYPVIFSVEAFKATAAIAARSGA